MGWLAVRFATSIFAWCSASRTLPKRCSRAHGGQKRDICKLKKKKKKLKLRLNQELENLRNFGWRTISLYRTRRERLNRKKAVLRWRLPCAKYTKKISIIQVFDRRIVFWAEKTHPMGKFIWLLRKREALRCAIIRVLCRERRLTYYGSFIVIRLFLLRMDDSDRLSLRSLWRPLVDSDLLHRFFVHLRCSHYYIYKVSGSQLPSGLRATSNQHGLRGVNQKPELSFASEASKNFFFFFIAACRPSPSYLLLLL